MSKQQGGVRHNYPKGEAHPQAVLTDDIVREIRRRYGNGQRPSVLADEYGVRPSRIIQIAKRRAWQHVTDIAS